MLLRKVSMHLAASPCGHLLRVSDNPGTSIANAVEAITRHKLSRPAWIEHYPSESQGGAFDTWALITLESYEVEETPFYLGRAE